VKIEVAQKIKFDEKENIVEMLQKMDNVGIQKCLNNFKQKGKKAING